MKPKVVISTFYEYFDEGAAALRLALYFKKLSKIDENESEASVACDMNSRYAFLMFANGLEAAANALLLDIKLPDDTYKELEKLDTMTKIYLHCNLKNNSIDKGNHLNCFIKEIIRSRNEFVHPKPKDVDIYLNNDMPTLKIKKTKSKNYPLYFSAINLEHSVEALKDILAFLSWILFDVCKYSSNQGRFAVGYGSFGNTSDIDFIGRELKIKFDLRLFK